MGGSAISELRHDPVTGVSAIIEPDRALRPRDLSHEKEERQDPSSCPFCAGHEDMTPPTRAEYKLEGDESWRVRVVENKYPALAAGGEEDWAFDLDAPPPYSGTTGFGVHEVIVETPEHDEALADYSPEHAALLVDAYADRIRVWREDGRFAASLLFRNYGKASGASLYHVHSQFVALPLVPAALVRELGNFTQYAGGGGRCLLCDAMQADDSGDRIVYDDGITVVHSPWAAPVPCFMRISPRRCADSLADTTAEQRASFGQALVVAAKALKGFFGDPAFNVVLHDAPYSAQHAGLPYHWHADVIPRTNQFAGFELGAGIYLNVMDPGKAAVALREALLTDK